MIKAIPRKIRTALAHPEALGLRLRSKLNLFPYYYWGDGGYSASPRIIYLTLNSVCNMRCKMCDVGAGGPENQFYQNLIGDGRSQLSLERLKALVDEVRPFRPVLALNGTEPLLYRGLEQFCRYAIDSGLEVHITTNGLLLGRFAQGFVDMGLQRLWVSLDGPAEVHDQIRGVKGGFKRIYAGMRRIKELKARHSQAAPWVYVNYTISNHNYYCLVDFMAAIADLGVAQVTFSHMNFVTPEMAERHNALYGHICRATPSSLGAADPLEVDAAVLAQQVAAVRAKYGAQVSFSPDLASEKEIEVFYRQHDAFVAGRRCQVAWQVAQVLANGDLVPLSRCFHLPLGNINAASFQQAWNSEPMRAFRRKLRQYGAFPACARCCGLFS